MTDHSNVHNAIAQIREEFDAAFAEPRPLPEPLASDATMLIARVGDARVAIRLSQVAALRADVRVVPIPGRSDLPGLAGIDERLVLVAALCDLPLGIRARRPAGHNAVVVSAADPGVAFLFDRFQGAVDAGRDGLVVRPAPVRADGTTDPVTDAILTGHPAGVLRVLALDSLFRYLPAAPEPAP